MRWNADAVRRARPTWARCALRTLAMAGLASMACAGTASAVLIDEGDWLLDTNTSLQWLNLEIPQYNLENLIIDVDGVDYFVGYSVDEILAGAGGFFADDWRYATTGELCGLLSAYASTTTCPGRQSHPDADASGLITLMLQLGTTGGDNEVSTAGYFDDGDWSDGVGLAGFLFEVYGAPISAGQTTLLIDYGDSSAENYGMVGYSAPRSHFLVRSVPEPGTGLMVGVGIAAIARRCASRRRTRA